MRIMAIHRAATLALVLGVVLASGASSSAQCDYDWLGHQVPSIGFEGIASFAVFDDGAGPAIYAGGSFEEVCGEEIQYLARWNGTTWSSVGGGVDHAVHAVETLDLGDGFALYVEQSTGIWRWNGSNWLSLGEPNHNVSALAAFDDGSGGGPALFAGGWQGVSKWNGAQWTRIATLPGGIDVLAAHDDGSGPALYAGGNFSQINGLNIEGLARWNGSQWSAVGGGVVGNVDHLLSTTFGGNGAAQLYVAGVSSAGGQPATGFARWDGLTWHPLPSGHTLNWFGSRTMVVWADDQGPGLFVSGKHRPHPDTDAVARVVKFDGQTWSVIGNFSFYGMSWIGEMVPFDDGNGQGEMLWVGGYWAWSSLGDSTALERWDGANWWPMPGQVDALHGAASTMKVLDVGDGNGPQLIAGGEFQFAGGELVNRIARWSGQQWSAFGAGFNDAVNALVLHDDGAGPVLLAGGAFTRSGQTRMTGVARWSGTVWQPLGAGIQNDDFTVYDMAAFDDGTGAGPALYVAGSFTAAGDVAVSNIAKWEGGEWRDVAGGVSGGPIHALEVFDDGSGAGPMLYVAGRFRSAGGQAVNHVARWDGSAWHDVAGGVGPETAAINDLHVHDDGAGPALYAAGSFSSAGGAAAQGVARWNGVTWSAVGSLTAHVAPSVRALTTFDDGSGPALHASGIGITESGVARWNDATWAGLAGPGTPPVSGFVGGGGPRALAGDNNVSGAGWILHVGGGFVQWRAGQSQALTLGSPQVTTFSSHAAVTVDVQSGGAVTIQWRRNGVALAESAHYRGVDTERLEIVNLQVQGSGVYDALVTSDCETTVSSQAVLDLPCTADIAPAPPGDGAVDVHDLLMVLARWGAFGPNLVEDLDHDGMVESGDVLIVTGQWGACP